LNILTKFENVINEVFHQKVVKIGSA